MSRTRYSYYLPTNEFFFFFFIGSILGQFNSNDQEFATSAVGKAWMRSNRKGFDSIHPPPRSVALLSKLVRLLFNPSTSVDEIFLIIYRI